MGKKERKAPEAPPGLPGWLATYSDMVTLLLTFFVMMMAMANFEDMEKVEAVMESIREALGVNGFDDARLMTALGEHLSEDVHLEENVQPTLTRLREALAAHVSDDMIRVSEQQTEIRLRLDERVFFRPGSAELHPAAYAVIGDLASVLSEVDVDLVVEGHTDTSGDPRANWQLSADRAVAVVAAIQERGHIADTRLTAVAKGASVPASTFAEDDGWNRRIEFVIRSDDPSASVVSEKLQRGGNRLGH